MLNLAYGLHAKGKRVLVIDCDPQSNVTSILTAESSLTTGDSNQLLENYRARTETGFMAALAALGEYVQS
ncbi:AAA family ATPase, partial [Faecalibaculum rodentium]|uniref:AAA family ATPase n=1 Tax=Faecalibaculum rodentium TaxID=1702221 RepID=UPI0026169F16